MPSPPCAGCDGDRNGGLGRGVAGGAAADRPALAPRPADHRSLTSRPARIRSWPSAGARPAQVLRARRLAAAAGHWRMRARSSRPHPFIEEQACSDVPRRRTTVTTIHTPDHFTALPGGQALAASGTVCDLRRRRPMGVLERRGWTHPVAEYRGFPGRGARKLRDSHMTEGEV
jgi:hypothetical protein